MWKLLIGQVKSEIIQIYVFIFDRLKNIYIYVVRHVLLTLLFITFTGISKTPFKRSRSIIGQFALKLRAN